MTDAHIRARSSRWPGLDSLLPDSSAGNWRHSLEPQGVPVAARALAAAELARGAARSMVVVAPHETRADQLVHEMRMWLGETGDAAGRVLPFPRPDARPYERIPWTGTTRQSRLTVLAALMRPAGPEPAVVVTSMEALMQKTLPRRELWRAMLGYGVGELHQISDMALRLVDTGYVRRPVVDGAGLFAQRGSILDVWPANLLYPVRLDFFGDEIESIRAFDPESQRSTGQRLDRIGIGPASEALARLGPEMLTRVGLAEGSLNAASLATRNPASRGPLQDPGLSLFMQQELDEEVRKLHARENFPLIEWYLPYLYDQPGCLLDYLDASGLLVLDDGSECEMALVQLERQATELHTELRMSGEVPERFASSHFSYDEIWGRVTERAPLLLGHGDLEGTRASGGQGVGRRCRIPDLRVNPRHARPGALEEAARNGAEVVIVSRMVAQVTDMMEAVDRGVERVDRLDPAWTAGRIQLVEGTLEEGFSLTGEDGDDLERVSLMVVTDTELFDVRKVYRRRQSGVRKGITPEQFFAEVSQGDPVVHVDFGIGLYAGLAARNLKGVDTEYIQVDFQGRDKVLVPVHQADRVSRYVGAENPALSKLGSSRWSTAKAKVKKEVEDIAEDLLQIYARREASTGRPTGPDDALQNALEMSFPFAETPDQMTAILDVKTDLETARHMDRLIVGDVGFGKTEVALRAAFKVVADNRQVAVLVPTTVLAHQHYITFTERMRNLPVNIGEISRLRSTAERRAVKEGLAQGGVDIVVGTHALLAKDVRFRDLGLLIIDEEQRFGVKQKERIKRLKPAVNVLTMSATPIPRTMNMGLSGIRDISYITTAPEERLPVHTVMSPYDGTLVRKALERELNRDGQAFVVTDRVRGIVGLADEITRLAPSAVMDIAHGQMKGEELEDAMLRFARGDTQVLVCTTIIENGLDIPNANTMIVNRADRFGMAQLYQLRGRVGRSHRRGHCYLLYAAGQRLSPQAMTRLQTIVESSDELGAGFRIAMSDLQLRGAGEILGARQSGSMGTIGLDLYTRMLTHTMENLHRRRGAARTNGQAVPTEQAQSSASDPFTPAVTMHLPLDSRIPEWYIEDGETRYRFYHRIAGLRNDQEADEFRQELIDRFGSVSARVDAIPEEVENLLYQIKVKRAAEQADIELISHRHPELLIKPREGLEQSRHRISAMLQRVVTVAPTTRFATDKPWRVGREGIYLSLRQEETWPDLLLTILERLADFRDELRRARTLQNAQA